MKLFAEQMESGSHSRFVAPRLVKHLDDIRDLRYGRCNLEQGWLVTGDGRNGKPIEWKAREPDDCLKDLKSLAESMIEELDKRFENCFPALNSLLHECLDFRLLFQELCGTRHGSKHPVNKAKYAAYGANAYNKCVDFVSCFPHIKENNMEFGPGLSLNSYWQLKSTIMEVVWGTMYKTHFSQFFKLIKPVKEKSCTAVRYKTGVADITVDHIGEFAVSFLHTKPEVFTLSETFLLHTNHNKVFCVALQEDLVIQHLYNDQLFYSSVGMEFCALFDILCAKTGTEAVAESFYGLLWRSMRWVESKV